MMLGRKNNGNRFLPFLIALFFSFRVSGCGRASDTSGLAGEWVLDAVNSGGISLPDLLVVAVVVLQSIFLFILFLLRLCVFKYIRQSVTEIYGADLAAFCGTYLYQVPL